MPKIIYQLIIHDMDLWKRFKIAVIKNDTTMKDVLMDAIHRYIIEYGEKKEEEK